MDIEENNKFVNVNSAVIKAADTIEETIAIRNNNIVKNDIQLDNDKNAVRYQSTIIDIDDAQWNKKYAEKMERNLEKFKELGLYKQLQDLGIVYDESQFKKNHIIFNSSSGKQVSVDGAMDSYDEAERQFEEIDNKELLK